MIAHLDRKLLRDLARLKGQAAAVSLVMACGLAMLIMARSLIHSLESTRAEYYQTNHFAEIFASLKRAPNDLGARLAAVPGVATVQTDLALPVTLDLPGVAEPASGLVRSLPDFGAPELNRLFLRRGRWLSSGARDEVLVGEAFASANGLNPGDTLAMLLRGRREVFHVAGIVLSPEYIFESRPGAALPDSRTYGIFWMPYKEVATAGDLYGAFNHVSLTLAPGANEPEVIAGIDRLLRPYGGLGAYGRKDHPSHIRVSDEIRVLTILSVGFPSIFLSVAAFMTNAVLSRLLALQREQIAILKAFGFTNRAIVVHYLKFAFVMVAAGVIFGLLGGIALGHKLVVMYELFFRFPDLAFRLDGHAVAIALGVGLGAVTLGVFSSVRQAAKLPPAEAMRPEPPASFRPAFIERTALRRLLSHSFRIAVRNLERRPVQALFTVAGLALATALLILPNTFKAGIADILDFKWDVNQRQDLNLSLIEPSSARLAHELAQLPGVTSLEPARFAAVRIHFQGRSRQIALRSLIPGAMHSRAVDDRQREIPPPTDGLIVSAKLAEVLGAKPGDLLVIEALEGRRPVMTVPLVGLAEDFTGIAAYMELHAINRFLGEGDVITGASLGLDMSRRAEFLVALKGIPRVSTVAIKETMRKSFRETTAQMMGLIQSIYLMFSVVVAFGVIYNNARISLAERARELATLRVVGMTQREVGAIIVIELVILAALAVPLGLALGTGFATVIVTSVNTETVRLPLVFTSYTYSFAVVVVTTASILSALVVLRKLKQLDLIATLKAPE
ncbi:ABC transporter permease [Opitutus sp. GAS368]|uniref:ABC transporter permease n=1 Tax=Opitutus sp. GAS368 TaxID=1882749 RepID=UPI000879C231|nr:ABC transporter permease [Opitutus sp. GAS368]SDR76456.1 putative ABC transport system permease protein [Opitutus sp. GAS368]